MKTLSKIQGGGSLGNHQTDDTINEIARDKTNAAHAHNASDDDDTKESAASKVKVDVAFEDGKADISNQSAKRQSNKIKWIIVAVVIIVFIVFIAVCASPSQPPDATALNDTLNDAEQTYELGQGYYTDESWNAFVSAYDDAQSLLVDEDASQSDLDTAEQTLSDAEDELELKPVDKSSLNETIATYSGYAEEDYTSESWQSFYEALLDAQEVADDADATQAEVDSADLSLTSAASDLVEAFDPDDYTSVSFEELARNPDSYAGQKVVVSGRVVQVVEGSTETDLRVATDGAYDDIVFVGFDPSIIDYHILEDDNVTVYGTCIGQFSYESTLGATISLPGIYGDRIELN